MDKAKAAVSDFMSKSGHHDTTVHEKVAPAVTHETISPHRHEEVQTAIDKEVHQDHHHTSVQPVLDRQVLPEQHQHNMVGVEHKHMKHGDDQETTRRLQQEASQYRDQQTTQATKESHSALPTIGGEHMHHHVHETIQPVVQKETIQPNVVHTTVPIHEVHENAAQHHASSALPAVSMADFKKQGGSLTGREERYDGFQGEPKSVGGSLGGGSSGHGTTERGTTSGIGRETGNYDSNTTGGGYGSNSTGRDNYENSGTQQEKPSMMDKMNPKKDADGDGKAGFMK